MVEILDAIAACHCLEAGADFLIISCGALLRQHFARSVLPTQTPAASSADLAADTSKPRGPVRLQYLTRARPNTIPAD